MSPTIPRGFSLGDVKVIPVTVVMVAVCRGCGHAIVVGTPPRPIPIGSPMGRVSARPF
jgi:hypothetical protein